MSRFAPSTFAAALPLIAAALSVPAVAQDAAAEFYKGKQVNVIIGNPPGGGYDGYARLLTRSMGRHIPGNPTLVARNMPGAGGATALSHIEKAAPRDGTVFGNAQPPTLMEPILQISDRKMDFDPRKLFFLGSANLETSLCIVRNAAPAKTFSEAMTKEVVVGGSGSSTVDYPLTHNAILGTKFKVITGYKGTRAISLEMQRGEVDGLCGLFWSSMNTLFPDWRTKKEFTILVQEATIGLPELDKMGVPTVYHFAKTEEQRQAMDLMYKPLIFGRPFVMADGIPPERGQALRTAFDAVMKDPQLLADAEKQHLPINPTSGAEVQKLMAELYTIPEKVVVNLRQALVSQRK